MVMVIMKVTIVVKVDFKIRFIRLVITKVGVDIMVVIIYFITIIRVVVVIIIIGFIFIESRVGVEEIIIIRRFIIKVISIGVRG